MGPRPEVVAKALAWVTVVVVAGSIVAWRVTGGDYYTKFEVVEVVERPVDPSDPFAAADFYDSGTVTETVKRKQFRFGLFPVPAGLLDKHMLSVVTVSAPFGLLTITMMSVWWARRRIASRHGGTRTG
jgi:hypothetical protein